MAAICYDVSKRADAEMTDNKSGNSNDNNADTQDPFGFSQTNWEELGKNLAVISERAQNVLKEFAEDSTKAEKLLPIDPLNIAKAFSSLFTSWAAHPQQFWEAQSRLWQSHADLWQTAIQQVTDPDTEPYIAEGRRDKRFRDEGWQQNFIFNMIKQSYLVTAKWLQETVAETSGLGEQERKKVDFYTQQFVDAISPSNFMSTNPQVLKATMESNGENLIKGLENLLHDLERGHGKLAITQTDMDFFHVGENIATTPGKVVFQNEIFQLLQYTPSTEKVHKTPLLIFPPWINKFYILDLREDNSFIKWMVDKGYTVFVVSWVNPDASLSNKTFEDYMFQGIFEALDAVKAATGEEKVNTIGYCIGGTLLGATLAYMADQNIDRIKSATFFTAQVDFSEAGELLVFIDEDQLRAIEKEMDATGGYLEGTSMASTFNMLRSNDLIWSYVVNNYLLGKDPTRFDLLYWNADSTRMPKDLHLYYLRECYLKNSLSQGQMILGGTALDLTKVKTPIFLQSGRDDHIAPYRSVYKASHLYSGPVEFMVAGSGHIAGVVNHPDAKKYQYWTNQDPGSSVDEWWEGAEEHPGSWWPYWEKWLRKKSGKKVDARTPGDGDLDVLEDAPGSYVKVKAE